MIDEFDLRTIDKDLIRDLRRRGRRYEAYQLLQAYYDSKKKNKEQLIKELNRQEAKKRYFKQKNEIKEGDMNGRKTIS